MKRYCRVAKRGSRRLAEVGVVEELFSNGLGDSVPGRIEIENTLCDLKAVRERASRGIANLIDHAELPPKECGGGIAFVITGDKPDLLDSM